jgi:hypothetical protein
MPKVVVAYRSKAALPCLLSKSPCASVMLAGIRYRPSAQWLSLYIGQYKANNPHLSIACASEPAEYRQATKKRTIYRKNRMYTYYVLSYMT